MAGLSFYAKKSGCDDSGTDRGISVWPCILPNRLFWRDWRGFILPFALNPTTGQIAGNTGACYGKSMDDRALVVDTKERRSRINRKIKRNCVTIG